MSQYGLCFVGCVLGNHQIAAANNYEEHVAFVMDDGNCYSSQVQESYAAICRAQEDGLALNLGSLTFADDKRVTALQASDLVCWAVRRRATNKSFEGFEPLAAILDQRGHNQSPFSEDSMREIMKHLDPIPATITL